ncbi:hypothetical protein IEQ34_015527 [Dendrobium chrysotoxum]|uniref:Uncharacterized protein n=1 Tax=Dendrobium chrysotoxum TaxID=161865 RepID=A0AAV7GI73_DENCH|nr:hypothetical protein IEQ34_015527 [Dendrobium chrysotoxum]
MVVFELVRGILIWISKWKKLLPKGVFPSSVDSKLDTKLLNYLIYGIFSPYFSELRQGVREINESLLKGYIGINTKADISPIWAWSPIENHVINQIAPNLRTPDILGCSSVWGILAPQCSNPALQRSISNLKLLWNRDANIAMILKSEFWANDVNIISYGLACDTVEAPPRGAKIRFPLRFERPQRRNKMHLMEISSIIPSSCFLSPFQTQRIVGSRVGVGSLNSTVKPRTFHRHRSAPRFEFVHSQTPNDYYIIVHCNMIEKLIFLALEIAMEEIEINI